MYMYNVLYNALYDTVDNIHYIYIQKSIIIRLKVFTYVEEIRSRPSTGVTTSIRWY